MMCAAVGKWGAGRRISMGIVLALFLCAGPVAPTVWAGAATDAMKGSIDELLRVVQDKDLKQPGKTPERRKLLEQTVSERFDFEEMSLRALGAPWKQLSDQEKKEFVALFRTLLINTYREQIETYSGDGVQYLNERVEKAGDKEYAEVRTKIFLSDKSELRLDYKLINKDKTNWRVYDVVIQDIGLISNYQKQFTKIIRASSYQGLVDQLRTKSDKIKAP
ncbi:MAG TPA: ABC transporter substrate-binding protein [Nitrospiraceae bacterium]|jgi:phospholipid transport system substrate-binding protein